MEQREYELAAALRHELHAHPELSGQEDWTRERLMSFLREHTALEIVPMGGWFYAVYHSGTDQPSIAFRADFDALPVEDAIDAPYRSRCPGVGHKCGHDGHSAALAALALEVDRRGAGRDVYFVFQHAEEIGAGGEVCAAALKKLGVEEVYAFHNMSGYPRGAVCLREGTMHCASRGMILRFTGTPAHASTPERGRNPAFAVARLVCAIPELTDPEGYDGLVLCTVIQINVGEPAFGVSAHRGELLLTIRAQYERELAALQSALEALARREAGRYGLELEIGYQDVFPETANHPAQTEKVRRAARRLGFPVCEMAAPERCSEDFGYYLHAIPGAMFFLGNGEDYPPLHSAAFDFPDKAIRQAERLFQALIEEA